MPCSLTHAVGASCPSNLVHTRISDYIYPHCSSTSWYCCCRPRRLSLLRHDSADDIPARMELDSAAGSDHISVSDFGSVTHPDTNRQHQVQLGETDIVNTYGMTDRQDSASYQRRPPSLAERQDSASNLQVGLPACLSRAGNTCSVLILTQNEAHDDGQGLAGYAGCKHFAWPSCILHLLRCC